MIPSGGDRKTLVGITKASGKSSRISIAPSSAPTHPTAAATLADIAELRQGRLGGGRAEFLRRTEQRMCPAVDQLFEFLRRYPVQGGRFPLLPDDGLKGK